MLSIELDPNQHIKKKKKMGTGRALVWYSPKSYPNQTHIRELKEKNNNKKKKKKLFTMQFIFTGFLFIKGGLLIWFALLFFLFNVTRCPNWQNIYNTCICVRCTKIFEILCCYNKVCNDEWRSLVTKEGKTSYFLGNRSLRVAEYAYGGACLVIWGTRLSKLCVGL